LHRSIPTILQYGYASRAIIPTDHGLKVRVVITSFSQQRRQSFYPTSKPKLCLPVIVLPLTNPVMASGMPCV
jgi:hypothetical protein